MIVRVCAPFFSARSAEYSTVVAALALSLLIAGEASAQQRPGSDHVVLGIGVAYAPTYQGAKDYRALPLPALDIAAGPFFANFRNGIGYKVIDTGDFTVGASVAPTMGYRARDVPEGVGRLSFGAGGRLFMSANLGGVIAGIGATRGFAGGTKGVVADASLAYPILLSPKLQLIPSAGVSWANRRHNDRYFGIDRRQSIASGLPVYHLGSGFKDATASLTANYRLTARLSLSVTGGVTTLLSDAVRQSPLIERKARPTLFTAMSYRL